MDLNSAGAAAIAACHRAYWRLDEDELAAIEARARQHGLGRAALRWHHLRWMAAATSGATAAIDLARASAEVLRLSDAHRGRLGRVWTLGAADASAQGVLDTASPTHPGVLEYIEVDGAGDPVAVGFVSWSALASVELGPPAPYRAAVLAYEAPDRPPALVRVPTRHGLADAPHAGALLPGAFEVEVAQRGVPARLVLRGASRITLDPDPTFPGFEAACARRGVSPGWARTVYDDWGRPVRAVAGPSARTLSGTFPTFG